MNTEVICLTGAFNRLFLCTEWNLEVKTKKQGDPLDMLMMVTCLIVVTVERSEWILEVFGGKLTHLSDEF